MPEVFLKNVAKYYRKKAAVKNLTLKVNNREFFCLLGPPGSGRTTILRLIAGLEKPDSGEIYIDDRLVNDLPPIERDVAMMFESLALYPHMTVYENLAFPLRKLNLPEDEIKQRVVETAELLRIGHLLNRRPAQLSGGERQRVALGRALVKRSKILLLDEPLGHLDAKLRIYARAEIKRIQRELKQTVIMAAHDALDAMTVADRVALIKDGELLQVDEPEAIYRNPRNLFVAKSINSLPVSVVECSLEREGDRLFFHSQEFKVDVTKLGDILSDKIGKKFILGIRPSAIEVSTTPPGIEAKIYTVEPLGRKRIIRLEVGEKMILAECPSTLMPKIGKTVWLKPDIDRIYIFDEKEESIIK